MADEHKRPDEDESHISDSGLGNLPPLSDFDSGSGLTSDSGLPPLSSFESDTGDADSGGLPPISDIDVETPNPTGGAIKPGQGAASSGGGPLETPTHGGLGSGYQDLSADSDFSPETPEIGPGPDSDLDTPMFDSAFGGGEAGFDRSVDTPAPTQAMETPMFGGTGAPRDQGFDPGAFGGFNQPAGGGMGGMGGMGGFSAGTPMPDFSPDTNLPMGATPAPEDTGRGGRGGAVGILIAALIALIIGVVAGPYVAGFLPFLPNPQTAQIQQLQTQVSSLETQLAQARTIKPTQGGVEISQERLDQLTTELATVSQNLEQRNTELANVETSLGTARQDLTLIEEDIAGRSEEYVQLQEQYDELQNETAITEARQRGLAAEVERLTGQVGGLEEAAQRSTETKQALENAVDRLFVQVKEGLPLTPARFAHDERVAAVEALRSKLDEANYVTPELQKEYTDLYIQELQIASSKDYFYAKVPVTNRYGVKTYKWAEALMMGNWGVYYRTLDGKNIGTFENVGDAESPVWQFRENLPAEVQTQIESEVMANRPADYAEKIAVLAERELDEQEGTALQRQFNSL